MADYAAASKNLDEVLQAIEVTDSDVQNYHFLLSKAYVLLIAGDEPGALKFLEQGLWLGKRQGYITPQWSGWPTEVMSGLCVLALMHQIEVEYVTAIIRNSALLPLNDGCSPENWPWPVKIYTLGHFTVMIDNVPLETSSKVARKPLELLRTLIAYGGRAVNQQKLIQALWPDGEGDRKAFEITLHRLRKLFGTDTPLILKNKELSLDVRLCWLDCWTLERTLSKLDTAASALEVDMLLDQVFNLYQGPFFGHDADLYCALQLQEKLRSRFLRSVLRVAQHCEAEGRSERAMRCYERLLEVEPSVEEGYRRLVRLFQQQGHWADAKTCYLRCERVLRKVLGASPSFTLNSPGD